AFLHGLGQERTLKCGIARTFNRRLLLVTGRSNHEGPTSGNGSISEFASRPLRLHEAGAAVFGSQPLRTLPLALEQAGGPRAPRFTRRLGVISVGDEVRAATTKATTARRRSLERSTFGKLSLVHCSAVTEKSRVRASSKKRNQSPQNRLDFTLASRA
ncbi:hypothetical protein, partial [Paraburkholderia tropica]|uniref:hypothetical protein n=1 Tax=Paraburkholderia tropica TaxID=92647 RepID=UPI001E2F4665